MIQKPPKSAILGPLWCIFPSHTCVSRWINTMNLTSSPSAELQELFFVSYVHFHLTISHFPVIAIKMTSIYLICPPTSVFCQITRFKIVHVKKLFSSQKQHQEHHRKHHRKHHKEHQQEPRHKSLNTTLLNSSSQFFIFLSKWILF